METKESTTPAQSGNPGLLHADEIIVSVLETDADSVRIKLWPDAAAVRSRLSVLEMAMGADTYSIRRYVCGRALYCAVALDDATAWPGSAWAAAALPGSRCTTLLSASLTA